MQIDYYYAAMGQTRPDGTGGVLSVETGTGTGNGSGKKAASIADQSTVSLATRQVAAGSDGVNEVVLFSSTQNAPGNFGSLDIGSTQNSTGELERQILYGPTAADFANPDFAFKVNPDDGALYVPFTASGDTGLTTSVETAFNAIKGQPRIIPLYDTVTGNGENAVYSIVGYAGVVVTDVNFRGSPKRLWIQPAFVVSNKVGPATDFHEAMTEGMYLPPKLVIP